MQKFVVNIMIGNLVEQIILWLICCNGRDLCFLDLRFRVEEDLIFVIIRKEIIVLRMNSSIVKDVKVVILGFRVEVISFCVYIVNGFYISWVKV